MKITSEEFKRYANGLSSPEEKARMESWLNDNEDALSKIDGEDEQLSGVWLNLKKLTDEQDGAEIISIEKKQKPFFSSFAFRIAASIVVVMGIALFIIQQRGGFIAEEMMQMRVVSTKAGQRLNVTLPDGTQVALNAETELEFPEKFTGDQRLVKLKGEAFFSVTHDKSKPFIVHTDSSYTKVLGTQFNLEAYKNSNHVVLTVERGKVQFGRYLNNGGNENNNNDQVILTVGMQGVIDPGKKVFSQLVKAEETIAWKDNTFIIDNEQLADVAKRLERWYGVHVEIKSEELKSLTVTGTYRNAQLEQIMKSLAFSAGINYTLKNNTLTISK